MEPQPTVALLICLWRFPQKTLQQNGLKRCLKNTATACYACKKNGICVQKDGMAEILDKISKADVIVLSTPVYFYAVSNLNGFIDCVPKADVKGVISGANA